MRVERYNGIIGFFMKSVPILDTRTEKLIRKDTTPEGKKDAGMMRERESQRFSGGDKVMIMFSVEGRSLG